MRGPFHAACRAPGHRQQRQATKMSHALESDTEHPSQCLRSIQTGRILDAGCKPQSTKREEDAPHELREESVFSLVARSNVDLDPQIWIGVGRRLADECGSRIDDRAEDLES